MRAPVDRAYVLHEAPAQSLVPTDTIDVDGVGLRRVGAHVERDVLALVDASGGRIPFDLAHGVRPRVARIEVPPGRPRLLVLHDDRIGLRSCGGEHQYEEHDKREEGISHRRTVHVGVPEWSHQPCSFVFHVGLQAERAENFL